MIKDEEKDEILRSISLAGSALPESSFIQIQIGRNADALLAKHNGLPKIKPNLVKQFSLMLSQPLALKALNPFEIRCCLCNSVISYPAWLHIERFAVNQFYYFVCFKSTQVVNSSCFRR